MKNKWILIDNQTRLVKRLCLTFVLWISFSALSFAQSTYWWNDAVFYEVFVRSFKDDNGDGQGDLKGLMSKLDYLNDGDPATHNDLGVTALWLMPIQQSPSYHGYDVTDYRTVEADYGSNQDFKDFIAAAHSRGIKVIIDYVMNHTSSQHPWFTNSVASLDNKRDWYVWQNPKPTMTGPWGQQVWYTKSVDNNYYAIFWSEMPDLNYSKPEVKAEMFDVAKFWLQDMDVDGFRLDAVKYIDEDGSTLEDTPETIQFWKDFRASYKAADPDAFAVGEAWTTTDKIAPYVNNGGLDYCFEFDLATAIINACNSGSTTNVNALKSQIDEVISTYPFLQYGTFLTNHDINRSMSQFNNIAKGKMAASLLLTLPGVPYIYYGEEIGMLGSGIDENKRTPMQWTNGNQADFTTGDPWYDVNSDYTTKNVKAQQSDVTSLWNNYRKLIALHNNQAALKKGTYKNLTTSTTTAFSFLRQFQQENIIVVSNMSSSTASSIQLTLTQGGIAAGNYVLVELMGGTQLPVVIDNNGGFTNLSIPSMPGRSTYIYKLLLPSAVSTSLTLKVDMNAMISAGKFNPATETVNIVNDFGVSSTALSDGDSDGIYTLAVSSIEIGHKINYSYRINDTNDGREEIASREYIILEGANTVADIYQIQTTTGIENALKKGISIYPVPSNKELFIDFSNDFSGMINYKITDLIGEEKIASSFLTAAHAGQHQLSCEGLSPGVYLLNLSYNGIKQAFKIVIQK